MTVQEYLESTRWKRFSYRFQRNPFVLFVIAPLYVFLFRQRFAAADASPRERYSVWLMNLALLIVAILMSWAFGFWTYLLLQGVAWMVAGASGIWLFYIQHQFEDAYWERDEHWDYTAAALQGSSYYKLPRVLQWLSGNIGFHHIHHLASNIPNYNLERCHYADPVFQQVKPITLFESLKSLNFRLWDEASRKLVSFRRSPAFTKGAAHARRVESSLVIRVSTRRTRGSRNVQHRIQRPAGRADTHRRRLGHHQHLSELRLQREEAAVDRGGPAAAALGLILGSFSARAAAERNQFMRPWARCCSLIARAS
jgi:hypothetical protein